MSALKADDLNCLVAQSDRMLRQWRGIFMLDLPGRNGTG